MSRVLAAISAVLLIALAACGGSSSSQTLTGPNGDIDCQSVITDGVSEALSWPMRPQATPAGVSGGRCQRTFLAVGTITVGSLATGDKAKQTYDEQCARIKGDPGFDAALTDAIAGGGSGCALAPDPSVQTGPAELVLLSTDDVVLQIRLDAKAPLTPERLLSGMRELARTAQQAW